MLTEDKILHILFAVLYLLFLFERGYFQLKAMIVSGEAVTQRTQRYTGRLDILAPVCAIVGHWQFHIHYETGGHGMDSFSSSILGQMVGDNDRSFRYGS